MLSKADNEFLTRSGPGTPMGELLRRFWMPALLSEELPERDGPPKKIRILGEDLLAFRDTNGRVGVVEPHCPHRGAGLYFGRNEECGLRCASTAGSSTSTATASTCRHRRPSPPTRTRSSCSPIRRANG